MIVPVKKLTLALSLILGLTTSVSAGSHLPTGGEILQKGKILHKFPHIKTGGGFTTLEYIELFIMYDEDYYLCHVGYGNAHCAKKEIFGTSDIWITED